MPFDAPETDFGTNPACVCVRAYRCSTQWCVESHPGPAAFWTGSQLPHTHSSSAAGAAAQRTELPASLPSVSWDKHSLSNVYTYKMTLTQTCSPHNSHTPLHSAHPHTETNTGRQAGSLFHRAEGTCKKKTHIHKRTVLAVMSMLEEITKCSSRGHCAWNCDNSKSQEDKLKNKESWRSFAAEFKHIKNPDVEDFTGMMTEIGKRHKVHSLNEILGAPADQWSFVRPECLFTKS